MEDINEVEVQSTERADVEEEKKSVAEPMAASESALASEPSGVHAANSEDMEMKADKQSAVLSLSGEPSEEAPLPRPPPTAPLPLPLPVPVPPPPPPPEEALRAEVLSSPARVTIKVTSPEGAGAGADGRGRERERVLRGTVVLSVSDLEGQSRMNSMASSMGDGSQSHLRECRRAAKRALQDVALKGILLSSTYREEKVEKVNRILFDIAKEGDQVGMEMALNTASVLEYDFVNAQSRGESLLSSCAPLRASGANSQSCFSNGALTPIIRFRRSKSAACINTSISTRLTRDNLLTGIKCTTSSTLSIRCLQNLEKQINPSLFEMQ